MGGRKADDSKGPVRGRQVARNQNTVQWQHEASVSHVHTQRPGAGTPSAHMVHMRSLVLANKKKPAYVCGYYSPQGNTRTNWATSVGSLTSAPRASPSQAELTRVVKACVIRFALALELATKADGRRLLKTRWSLLGGVGVVHTDTVGRKPH